MTALTTYLINSTDGDTVCEIVGGEIRTTRVLIRLHDRRIRTGPNFDLVADIDLTNKSEQEACWTYRSNGKPKICIMAPACWSFGSRSRLNRVINPGTRKANCDNVDKPLAQFAAQADHAQLLDNLRSVNEQPVRSSVYETKPC